MTPDPHDLDSILNAALREYSNREPRQGLEHRILRHIETTGGSIETRSPARRWWWWAGGVLVTVWLAVLAVHTGRTKVEPIPPLRAQAAKSPVTLLPPAPAPRVVKVAGKRRRLPKLEKFPEPAPLTPAERALLRFVQSQPEQARQALSRSAQIEELTIEPLKIEALP
jgi:hypothetical protein